MFLKRLISGIVLIALSLLLIITGGYVLLFSTMALSLIGLFELYRAFSIQKSVPAILGYIITIVFYLNFIFPVFGEGTMMESAVFLFIAFLIALLAVYVFSYPIFKLLFCQETEKGFLLVTLHVSIFFGIEKDLVGPVIQFYA